MREIIREIATIDSVDAGYDLDNRFHTLYVGLANNKNLLDIYENNWSVGCGYWLFSSMKNGLDVLRPSFAENETILNLCLQGDAEKLEQFIRHHLQLVYDTIEWHFRTIGGTD